MSNLSKRLEQQTQAALKYYKEEREKAQQQAYNAPSAVQSRGQQSGQIVSRLDNSINFPSVQRQKNQRSAQIASRLDNSNLAQMQNSGLSRLKQLREEALEEERPRRGGASDRPAL